MINPDQLQPALKALQRLITHAKALAHSSANHKLAELLNDVELLPEFVGDSRDRTDELVEMLDGIARVHPGCRYIVEEFQRTCALQM